MKEFPSIAERNWTKYRKVKTRDLFIGDGMANY